jgi:predicted LPLAT superfamily acyltransferase
VSTTPSRATASWARAPERGTLALLSFMAWLSLRIGRAPARVLLPLIAAYFLATAGSSRRASREYLTHCLGRASRLGDVYRLFLAFSSTLHDRVFFLTGRFDLFDVEVHGAELFGAGGALLMGAHLGSFEAMRACGHAVAQRPVAMAMYEENARKVRALMTSLDPGLEQDIVSLGRVDSILELRERLDGGALVGVLADRTPGDEPVVDVDFLGARAPFPTGPMRMAAALRQRVYFMAGLYRGGNRYEIHFEPLADFSDLDAVGRAERAERVRAAVVRYAGRLEHYCRSAPDNFFNFHRFWR